MEIRPNDWSTLARLMLQVGLAPEKTDILRKRVEGQTRRPGSPYTLLIGSPESGIELVLEHWLGPPRQASFTPMQRPSPGHWATT